MDEPITDVPLALADALPKLWGFAWRLTRDKRDTEDLVQRACLRAIEKQQQFQADSSLLSWLFAITHSIWKNELRSRQSRPVQGLDVDETLSLQDHTQAPAEEKVLLDQVYECIEALPEDHRTVMLLITVEGFSYKETAKILDLPIGTVMSRLARARQRICEKTI